MLGSFEVEVNKYELELLITKALHLLGIPAHIKGYRYLREAIIMTINDPKATDLITKNLYPSIAKRYATTPSRVNRAIDHAIAVSWERSSNSPLAALLFAKRESKPKNSEFILGLANYIKSCKLKENDYLLYYFDNISLLL